MPFKKLGSLAFAFWLVLGLSALGGLGLLSKHYRKSDEGPIPPGPFAVHAEAWTSLSETSSVVDGTTLIERRLVAPAGVSSEGITHHLEAEHDVFRRAAKEKALRLLVYSDAESAATPEAWIARSEQRPDAPRPTIELVSDRELVPTR